MPDTIDSPSEVAQAREVFGRLRELLPEEKRSILEMKADDISSKDIGDRLGISERTVQRVLEDCDGVWRRSGRVRNERVRQPADVGGQRRRPPPSAWQKNMNSLA